MKDRVVTGIHDDATRRKLLQTRKLTLTVAVDICKANEVASKQLRVMTSAGGEDVNAVVSKPYDQSYRSKSKRKCKFCGREHEMKKEACPAFGKICRKCFKKNHFANVCDTKGEGQSQVCNVNEEELLVIVTEDDEDLLA